MQPNNITKDSLQDWLSRRLEAADMLKDKGFILDAHIVLCCSIDALGSIVWPGPQDNKKRFIELITSHVSVQPSVHLISLSIAAAELAKEDRKGITYMSASTKLQGYLSEILGRFDPNRGLMGKDVDRSETQVLEKLKSEMPSGKEVEVLKRIRKGSYASVLYKELRCGLLHAYSTNDEKLSTFGMSPVDTEPSYDNSPKGRVLHIPYNYVRSVLTAILSKLQADASSGGKILPKPAPSEWWIDAKTFSM